jgi:hypothetical protein
MEQAAHQIGVKLQWDDHTRDKLVKDAQAQAQAYITKEKSELEIAAEALKLRAEKQRQNQQALRERADTLKGKSALEMAALIEDPEQRRAMLDLATLAMHKEMTPDQILATLAAGSPAAAQALAQMSAAQKDETRKLLEEYKQMFGQSRERDERMLTRVTEMMAEAAKRTDPAPQQQIYR